MITVIAAEPSGSRTTSAAPATCPVTGVTGEPFAAITPLLLIVQSSNVPPAEVRTSEGCADTEEIPSLTNVAGPNVPLAKYSAMHEYVSNSPTEYQTTMAFPLEMTETGPGFP
ncbi:MAG: hypothetical protein ABSD78_17435 [Acidimicrobiales bacterium]|jgi:hypothetical protein